MISVKRISTFPLFPSVYVPLTYLYSSNTRTIYISAPTHCTPSRTVAIPGARSTPHHQATGASKEREKAQHNTEHARRSRNKGAHLKHRAGIRATTVLKEKTPIVDEVVETYGLRQAICDSFF